MTYLSVVYLARRRKRSCTTPFTALLKEVGDDRDLVDEEERFPDNWAGWRLRAALIALDGIGTTTATKLMARKRPGLRPIWNTVVAQVMGAEKRQWEPL